MGTVKSLTLARTMITHREVIDRGFNNTDEITSLLPPKLHELMGKIKRLGFDIHFRYDLEDTFMYQESGHLIIYIRQDKFREDHIAELMVLFIIRQALTTTYQIANKIMPTISGTLCFFSISLFRALIEFYLQACLGYDMAENNYKQINSYVNGKPISKIDPAYGALLSMVSVHTVDPNYTRIKLKEIGERDVQLAKWCRGVIFIIDKNGIDTESEIMQCFFDLELFARELGLIRETRLHSVGAFHSAFLNDRVIKKITDPLPAFGIAPETEKDQTDFCRWIETFDYIAPGNFWELAHSEQERIFRLLFEWLKENSYIRIADSRWPIMPINSWLVKQRYISGQLLLNRGLFKKARMLHGFFNEVGLEQF